MKTKREALVYGLVIAAFTVGIGLALAFTTDNPQYGLILQSWPLLLSAFFTTILISIATLVGAMLCGFVLFVMMRSSVTVARAVSNVFNEIIMGTPLLVMIFLVVYLLGPSIGYREKLGLGILALILYNSPYIANAYQTTAAVVDDDQYVVMELYQFKWYQRYMYIIIPQMVRPFIPSLVNNLSSVIKSSAFLNIVAVTELSYITSTVSARTFAFVEGYYIMWILYLCITIPLSLLAKYLSKKVAQ